MKLELHIKGGTQAEVVQVQGTWEDIGTQEERSAGENGLMKSIMVFYHRVVFGQSNQVEYVYA